MRRVGVVDQHFDAETARKGPGSRTTISVCIALMILQLWQIDYRVRTFVYSSLYITLYNCLYPILMPFISRGSSLTWIYLFNPSIHTKAGSDDSRIN